MIQDRTPVFPKAFTEMAFGLSDVLKGHLLHSIRYIRFLEWQDMELVIFLASLVVKKV